MPLIRNIQTEQGPVTVEGAEYDIYAILAREPDRVMAKDELSMRAGMGGNLSRLDARCASLRAKILAATGERLIANVWGVGYRLNP